MSLMELIHKYWKEVLPLNLIFLAIYKMERMRRFPNIPHRYFNPKTMDWFNYKKWREKEEARQLRIHHNRKVAEGYKPDPPKEV